MYREKVDQLTAAFEDDALKVQAFERLRALIEAVVLTPEDGDFAIDLRGEPATMLTLSALEQERKKPRSWRYGVLWYVGRWLRGQDP